MSRRPRPTASAGSALADAAVRLPGAGGAVPPGVRTGAVDAVAHLGLAGLVDAARRTDSPDGRAPGPTRLHDPTPVLRPWAVLLDEAAAGRLALTDRSYLRPGAVAAVSARLGLAPATREHSLPELYLLRQHARRAGLSRSLDGTVVLTARGRTAHADPQVLWDAVASSLLPAAPDVVTHACVAAAVHVACGLDADGVEHTLAQGWSLGGGAPTARDVETLAAPLRLALGWAATTSDGDSTHDSAHDPGPAQRALARAALLGG